MELSQLDIRKYEKAVKKVSAKIINLMSLKSAKIIKLINKMYWDHCIKQTVLILIATRNTFALHTAFLFPKTVCAQHLLLLGPHSASYRVAQWQQCPEEKETTPPEASVAENSHQKLKLHPDTASDRASVVHSPVTAAFSLASDTNVQAEPCCTAARTSQEANSQALAGDREQDKSKFNKCYTSN